jgi:hypothetical protein
MFPIPGVTLFPISWLHHKLPHDCLHRHVGPLSIFSRRPSLGLWPFSWSCTVVSFTNAASAILTGNATDTTCHLLQIFFQADSREWIPKNIVACYLVTRQITCELWIWLRFIYWNIHQAELQLVASQSYNTQTSLLTLLSGVFFALHWTDFYYRLTLHCP